MVVNQNPGGKQEAPVISVSSSGLITATAGDETTTRQLPTQGSTTITPGTSQKTAVSSGRYTTGNVYVAGDSDLVASNIKSGVNIFGVTGTFEGESVETCTVSISTIYSLNAKYTSPDGTLVQETITGNAEKSVIKGSIFCLYDASGGMMMFSQSGGTTITFPFQSARSSIFVGATSDNVSINVL